MAPGLAPAPPPGVVRPAGPPAAPHLRPEVALTVARAAAKEGRYQQALNVLRQALPQAGALTEVLRLEAAQLELTRGRDPYPHLAPVLSPRAPAALRRRAEELSLQAVATLPLPKAKAWRARALPAPLKRQVRGLLAQRQRDVAGMLQLLSEEPDDAVAGELAPALVDQCLSRAQQELVARALFQAGHWQEAKRLLAKIPYQPEEGFSLTFLRARTAYRLEAWEEAVTWFAQAELATTNPEEKASCWLFAARAWEQLGHENCAEELYRQIVALRPQALEGWTGLLLLLARKDQGWPAVEALPQAPLRVRQELTPRLCAALVWRGKLAPAQHLVAQSASSQPAFQLCRGVLALHLGKQEEARRLLVQVLANPQAGRLRELLGLVLPWVAPGGSPPPTRNLGKLANWAVEGGVPTARQALLAALRRDPDFAPLFSGNLPPPALPPAVAGMLEAGFAQEVAVLLPHLLPQNTPSELAWSTAFLAEAGNFREAARLSEKLWSQVGPIPAFLLPDELLVRMFPKAFTRLLPEAASPFSALLLALARQESRFDHRALSPVGARGLWQLMPATLTRLAPELAGSYGEDAHRLLALRHLQASAKRLGSDPLLLASAYNAGDSWVELWLGQDAAPHPLLALAVPYAETRSYLLAVTEGLFLTRHLE